MFRNPACLQCSTAAMACEAVSPLKQLQSLLIESLYPHADTVERQGSEHLRIFRRKIIGVGLKGDLTYLLHTVNSSDCLEDLKEVFSRQLRRSAAPKINRLDGVALQIVPAYLQFPAKGLDVSSFEFTEGSGVEVTINTTGFTKRNVNVDTCHSPVMLFTFCKCKTLGSETGYPFCLFM